MHPFRIGPALLLPLVALLLAAPPESGAQAREPVATLESHRPPGLRPAEPANRTAVDAAPDSRGVTIAKHVLGGAAIGAAAGLLSYLVLENTKEHTDHSEDGFIAFVLTVPATLLGAAVGLATGILASN